MCYWQKDPTDGMKCLKFDRNRFNTRADPATKFERWGIQFSPITRNPLHQQACLKVMPAIRERKKCLKNG